AFFDGPGGIDETIQFERVVFERREKAYKERDSVPASQPDDPELRTFYLYELAAAYSRCGNFAGANRTIADAITAISEIPPSDNYHLAGAWRRVAEIRERAGEPAEASAALMHIESA